MHMQEERQPRDPTRKLLKVFGVKMTTYEERTAALLEEARAASPDQSADLLRLAGEIAALTADLNARLREMNDHVLDTQAKVLDELRATIAQAGAATSGDD